MWHPRTCDEPTHTLYPCVLPNSAETYRQVLVALPQSQPNLLSHRNHVLNNPDDILRVLVPPWHAILKYCVMSTSLFTHETYLSCLTSFCVTQHINRSIHRLPDVTSWLSRPQSSISRAPIWFRRVPCTCSHKSRFGSNCCGLSAAQTLLSQPPSRLRARSGR